MYNDSNSSPIVTNCTFSGNMGDKWTGGMHNSYSSNPTVTNCTFSGNYALASGGMTNREGSSPTVTNCTFSDNSSAVLGGGMGNFDSSNPTVTNCIFWGNTPFQIEDLYSSQSIVNYSNVQGGWGDANDANNTNIDADPCFVDEAGGDLNLLPHSPCIDTGSNSAPNLPLTDFDGHPRIIDGDCNENAVVDMGAYEFNYAYMGDLDYNCRVELFDFSIFGRAWMTREGDPDWDWRCDMSEMADDYIDWRDLKVICENWLTGK
jgi:hypothetical protein